ncbi:hypothetical protein P170DRAFT_232466 [Aspergillus steynii IBT 23096]|uniref:Uncharacterized protein n=1 Tax=Aspergillus steynii IBT 23096 TaxID=1392250 RepID=A0A2I2G2E4_9EURO|nr:uncharacterized protein P170DRAFT_232466 [Aspergillus steynii IBT 23096]PLB47041.1 hypothetical protein P170DRAFT_232466 [Aspergillus steynii IBT 23096]
MDEEGRNPNGLATESRWQIQGDGERKGKKRKKGRKGRKKPGRRDDEDEPTQIVRIITRRITIRTNDSVIRPMLSPNNVRRKINWKSNEINETKGDYPAATEKSNRPGNELRSGGDDPSGQTGKRSRYTKNPLVYPSRHCLPPPADSSVSVRIRSRIWSPTGGLHRATGLRLFLASFASHRNDETDKRRSARMVSGRHESG